MKSLLTADDSIAATISWLMGEQQRLARVGWAHITGYLVLSTAPYVYLDLFAFDENGLYSLAGVVSWALGYILLVGLMNVGGHLESGKRTGVGTYFVLGLAIGVPVVLGFVAFLLPGLYLLARWLPAYSRALASDAGIGDAMRWSWDKTSPFAWPFAISILFPLIAYAVSLGLAFGYEAWTDRLDQASYTVAVILWNVVMSVGMAWLTVAGVAAYGMLARREEGFGAVFN